MQARHMTGGPSRPYNLNGSHLPCRLLSWDIRVQRRTTMGWREDFGNFDLGRLTVVGWLVFLLSIAAGIGAAIVVGSYWDSMFPPQPGSDPQNRGGPAGIAGAAAVAGFFFAG